MSTSTDSAAPAHSARDKPDSPSLEAETSSRWPQFALAGIVVLSIALYSWRIDLVGWGNAYYSAAVKAMSGDLTNFIFGSFDPAGVTTVDKPPMSMWPQVISVWIFGYQGWALLLPQILAGGFAVFLMHRTVRRWAGENAGLLAALILALTPVTVAVYRMNNPDPLMVLFCVAAAYAYTRSVQKGISSASATRWLLQAAFWIGCGFVTKLVAAWMIVPALLIGYFFGRETSWGRKITDVLAAGVVLFASSMWWVGLTALWPEPRPWIGGSSDGTAWNLIMGYNGLGRLFSDDSGGSDSGTSADWLLRMFGAEMAGQISWLLPISLLALVAAAVLGMLNKLPADHPNRAGWLMWGSWLIVIGLVLSYSQAAFQVYYTVQLAPAVAALTGAGIVLLWRLYRAPSGSSWVLLPVSIALTAGWAWVVIARAPEFHGWLRYAVVAIAVVAVGLLVIAKFTTVGPTVRVGALLGVAAMLLTPGTWSVVEATDADQQISVGGSVNAGPAIATFAGGGGIKGMIGPSELSEIMRTGKLPDGTQIDRVELTPQQRGMIDYVEARAGDAKVALAFEGGSITAGNFIVRTDASVIGMGGSYVGLEDNPSIDQLAQWQRTGDLGFVYGFSPDSGEDAGGPLITDGASERATWVKQNCAVVPASTYGGAEAEDVPQLPNFLGGSANTLYNCIK